MLSRALLMVFAAGLAFLALWPVPISPVAWDAPADPGHTGPFAPNDALDLVVHWDLGAHRGAEDIAIDADGRVYASTEHGIIVRFSPDGSQREDWADTGGRPLGMDFAPDGRLIVADAYRGLLAIGPDRAVTLLADTGGGAPIAYANDVAVARDGQIYFTDASSKFRPSDWGGTLQASVLDIAEHAGNGRLLRLAPESAGAEVLLDGLQFANGVAVSPDQLFVLVNETGNYRVLRHWIGGPLEGRTETLIDALPGFPDNVSTGQAGRFWVALVSPRSRLLDALADSPSLRRVIFRLPAALRPGAQRYAHVIAVDMQGTVLANLQDPQAGLPMITAVTETDQFLYLGSLTHTAVGRISKEVLATPR